MSQIPRLCAEEVAAQEQTGQVEECLKVNLLKLKNEGCKKVHHHNHVSYHETVSNSPNYVVQFKFTHVIYL